VGPPPPRPYDDRAVRTLLRRNPGAASARYVFDHTRRGTVLQYPLFRAVALGASPATIRLFASACPAALLDVGPGCGVGGTPLHAAAAFGASVDVVRLLIELGPEALALKTRYGYTPLHQACESGASDEAVELLAKVHPAALAQRTKLRETPADVAERRDRCPEVLAAMAAISLEPQPAGGGGIVEQTSSRSLAFAGKGMSLKALLGSNSKKNVFGNDCSNRNLSTCSNGTTRSSMSSFLGGFRRRDSMPQQM